MESVRKTAISILIFAAVAMTAGAQAVVSVRGGSVKKNKSSDNKVEKTYLLTSLKDATFKRDVADGFIIPYDADGNPLDTIMASGYKWNGSEVIKTSSVSIPVERGDTLIMFDAGAPGFQTQTVTWSI